MYFELDKESASKLPSLILPLFEAAGEDIQSDIFGDEAIRFYTDQGSEFYDTLNTNSSSDSVTIKMTKFKLCYENFGTTYVGTYGIADSFEIIP